MAHCNLAAYRGDVRTDGDVGEPDEMTGLVYTQRVGNTFSGMHGNQGMSEINRVSRANFFACVGLAAICLLVSAGAYFWDSNLKPALTSDSPTTEEIELAVTSLNREKLVDFFQFVLHGHREILKSLDGMISAGMQFTCLLFLALAASFAGLAFSFRKISTLATRQPE